MFSNVVFNFIAFLQNITVGRRLEGCLVLVFNFRCEILKLIVSNFSLWSALAVLLILPEIGRILVLFNKIETF